MCSRPSTLRNECATRSREEVLAGLDRISDAMNACIDRGLRQAIHALGDAQQCDRRVDADPGRVRDAERLREGDELLHVSPPFVRVAGSRTENAYRPHGVNSKKSLALSRITNA